VVENVDRVEISAGLGLPNMSTEGATGLVGMKVLPWVGEVEEVVTIRVRSEDGVVNQGGKVNRGTLIKINV